MFLHTNWKFNGVAGMSMLLTLLVVASGFVGRYIYNAIPRTPAGASLETADLEQQLQIIRQALAPWIDAYPDLTAVLNRLTSPPARGPWSVLTRLLWTWQTRLRWQKEKRRLQAAGVPRLAELEPLLLRRLTLQWQIDSLAAARQLLSLWRSLHIPIGVSLFILAFIHIGGALYFSVR